MADPAESRSQNFYKQWRAGKSTEPDMLREKLKLLSGQFVETKSMGREHFVSLIMLFLIWAVYDTPIIFAGDLAFVSPAVAYQPRGFILDPEPEIPSAERIRADLCLLRKSGFRSLVTYGAKDAMGRIPEIAREEGFDGIVVMGIWDVFAPEEWTNAIAQIPFTDGYCIGNEGLGVRYKPDELALRMAQLRQITGLPVTTSEPIGKYMRGPYRDWLLEHSDWLFPNVHPFWGGQLNPKQGVEWVVAHHDYLAAVTKRKVVIKEAGCPSAGSEGLSEETQHLFYEALEMTRVSFFYFEAFDQPWKKDVLGLPAIEAHWGLFYKDGTPKKAILALSDQLK